MTDLPVVRPPEPPAPETFVCANCHAPLSGEYCQACGQRHEPRVHSVRHFASEAFESLSHADSRLWRTLWLLVSRPGRLTHEFFAGRRVSYLPPFRLYLVISVFFFLVANLGDQLSGASLDIDVGNEPIAERTGSPDEAAPRQAAPGGQAAANTGDGEAKSGGLREQNAVTEFCKEFEKPNPDAGRNYARIREACLRSAVDHGRALLETLVHNLPHAMFVFLPLLALMMKPLYWRPRRYYVEHLLFLIHNHAFVFLVLGVMTLLTRIPVVGAKLGPLEIALWIYITWYIFRAMRVYYGQSRGRTFWKFLTIGYSYLLTSATVLVLTAVFTAITM